MRKSTIQDSFVDEWTILKKEGLTLFYDQLNERSSDVFLQMNASEDLNQYGLYCNIWEKDVWNRMKHDYKKYNSLEAWIEQRYDHFSGISLSLFSPEVIYTIVTQSVLPMIRVELKPGYQYYHAGMLSLWEGFKNSWEFQKSNPWSYRKEHSSGQTLDMMFKKQGFPYHFGFYQKYRLLGICRSLNYPRLMLLNHEAVKNVRFFQYKLPQTSKESIARAQKALKKYSNDSVMVEKIEELISEIRYHARYPQNYEFQIR